MIQVNISPVHLVPNSEDRKKVPTILKRVRVEYHMRVNAASPFHITYMNVPVHTDLRALEHMLELWSISNDNQREAADASGEEEDAYDTE